MQCRGAPNVGARESRTTFPPETVGAGPRDVVELRVTELALRRVARGLGAGLRRRSLLRHRHVSSTVKPTPAGRILAADAEETPPYPGAKPYLLIDAERWEEQDWLSDLVRATAAELPAPKPKPAKAPKKTS